MDTDYDYQVAALEDRLDSVEAELADLKELLAKMLRTRPPEPENGLAYGHLRAVVDEAAD